MTFLRAASLLFVLVFSGCATPGHTYAGKHPELSANHRSILLTGKIPPGDAVAGMTHDEVKLAMKGDPTTYERINGEEAWIYVTKKSVPTTDRDLGATTSSTGKPEPYSASDSGTPEKTVNLKTTIFFQGDRATHAETTQEKP